MGFSLQTLVRSALGRPPKLVCASGVWHKGVDELGQRAARERESGAFLLGLAKGNTRRIEQFLFYDDVDPNCFAHGIVEFDGGKFGIVWEHCRSRKMKVVADVHVHPGHFGQSSSDRCNPMIPEVGHMALIIPDFAARDRLPGRIGIYEYLGARRWRDHSKRGANAFHIGWWPR
jgi:proteasome lid subunit RPN8/RPN11